MSYVFDGRAFAKAKERVLATKIVTTPRVVSFVFTEDEGSVLYTRLKAAAAKRIGISYQAMNCSMTDSLSELVARIREASEEPSITGVMIQKPAKSLIPTHTWWETLTSAIAPAKDVDGLTHNPLVLPATVRAVVSILEYAKHELRIDGHRWKSKRVVILGRSDIVGKPLAHELCRHHTSVDIFGKSDMPHDLLEYDIVISAVGKENLVRGEMVKDGVIIIDVGAPRGDVEFASVVEKALFITPVPGGVGPVTVVSLMENVIQISQ